MFSSSNKSIGQKIPKIVQEMPMQENFKKSSQSNCECGVTNLNYDDTDDHEEQTIHLKAGWNPISFDVSPEDKTIENVFNSVNGNLAWISTFDKGTKTYNPNGWPVFNTLKEIKDGFGYWVNMLDCDELIISGTPIDDCFIRQLDHGWNLVAYPSDSPQSPAIYFESLIPDNDTENLTTTLEFVSSFECGSGTKTYDPNIYPFLNSLTEMKNGFGYWVKVDRSANINVTDRAKFAVIGDFGMAERAVTHDPESGIPGKIQAVANLVDSWEPDFVVTTGDNAYELYSQYYATDDEVSTNSFDDNVGQFYGHYITSNPETNRFFPCPGNHDYHKRLDYGKLYYKYFSLDPDLNVDGDEIKYYDFVKGNVHLFSVSSNEEDDPGITAACGDQYRWLQDKLTNSTSKYKIVYFHHPPFSSGPQGCHPEMDWPFKDWGATAVLVGDNHHYERLEKDGFPYFVNGAGGDAYSSFCSSDCCFQDDDNVISKKQVGHEEGAMLIEELTNGIKFEFWAVSNNGTPSDQHIIYDADINSKLGASTNVIPSGVTFSGLSVLFNSFIPGMSGGSIHYEVNIAEPGKYNLALIDMSGKVLHSEQVEYAFDGAQEGSFKTADLPSGIYVLKMSNSKFSLTEKIIIH